MRNETKRCINEFKTHGDYSIINIIRKNGEIVSAIVDNDVLNECKKYHWQYNNGYFRTSKYYGNITLHHIIYAYKKGEIPNNMQIDHINGNTLDNRINNLRQCTIQENARNSRKRPVVKAGGIIGVRKDVRCQNSWRAQIYIDQNNHIEKTYNDKELAVIQRLIWELKYFGEYAPQIELIKKEYSYLLNYLKIKDTMQFVSDITHVREIGSSLKENPHCPCMIKENENTICPCLPCRKKQHCHCGMFEKI